ncbi:MAG TPA: hypothetical protein VGO43_00720 [Pyrinomonadaceae bacterium]|nr:hypothetical protein [Pyrinomonadaceae bacterium]
MSIFSQFTVSVIFLLVVHACLIHFNISGIVARFPYMSMPTR